MKKKPISNLGTFIGAANDATKTTPKPTPADQEIAIAAIKVLPQVRTQFPADGLNDLMHSIVSQGVLEPVILHEVGPNQYELICGERRLRASKLANRTTIPAIIKRGLSKTEIRQIQIAENNEREDLTVFDEAMGVATDVEEFGAAEAKKIWNRSETWISKRVSVTKYDAIIRALLADDLVKDLETLHGLNKLRSLDATEYQHMEKRIRGGYTVTRDEVRDKVASVKRWQGEQKAIKERLTATQHRPVSVVEKNATFQLTTNPLQDRSPLTIVAEDLGPKSPGVSGPKPKSTPEAKAEKQIEALRSRFRNLLVELYDTADVNRKLFTQLGKDIQELGCDMNQTDWAMWSGMLTVILPIFGSVGNERAARFLKKAQTELRRKSPDELWSELHPLTGTSNAPDAPRQEIAVMPEDWRM